MRERFHSNSQPLSDIQWNPSNLDTIGPGEGVLISGVMVLGDKESVLFREVSFFQGCPLFTGVLIEGCHSTCMYTLMYNVLLWKGRLYVWVLINTAIRIFCYIG